MLKPACKPCLQKLWAMCQIQFGQEEEKEKTGIVPHTMNQRAARIHQLWQGFVPSQNSIRAQRRTRNHHLQSSITSLGGSSWHYGEQSGTGDRARREPENNCWNCLAAEDVCSTCSREEVNQFLQVTLQDQEESRNWKTGELSLTNQPQKSNSAWERWASEVSLKIVQRGKTHALTFWYGKNWGFESNF